MAYDSDEYNPDSEDESNNNAEEEQRPNRWPGPPSTWQQLNSAEIDTLTALNEIRNRDLAVHLYNAFALRHRRGCGRGRIGDGVGPVAEQDIDVATGQTVQDTKWVPPNAWTAWPLPATAVPRPGFMGPTEEADDASTFKMRTPYEPRAELEDTLSAAMLRLAKERFKARGDEETVTLDRASSGEEGSEAEMSSRSSRARSKSKSKAKGKSKPKPGSKNRLKYESTSEGDMMDVDDTDDNDDDVDTDTRNQKRKQKKKSASTLEDTFPLKTVVATDDELSYNLLRPSVRGIIAKLDTTLSILHNAQESKTNCPSESSGSDASSCSPSRSRSRSRSRGASSVPELHSRSPTKRRQNPRSNSRIPRRSRAPSTARESAPEDSANGKKRRGRPRKIYPQLEGETERDYAIRVARLRKERLTIFADVDDDNITTNDDNVSDSASGKNKNKNKPKGKGKATPKARPTTRRRDSETTVSSLPETSETSSTPRHRSDRRPQLARARLRDWRDILGAAALAGFPAPALDRAARRCADLFGQSFAMHTLYEGPVDGVHDRVHNTDKRVQYEPGMIVPVDSEGSGEGGEERMSRATSVAPSEGRSRSRSVSLSRSQSLSQPRSRSRSKSRPRSRSRSASTAGGLEHYCIFSNCPRATDPFDRRPNLTRHYRLIHNYEADEETSGAAEDVESQDEMYGAVHVDGFLRPIKMRPGWRGEDAAREKRRPKRRVERAEGDLSD
ncbi:RNA polymerase I-specific transcription initiation factor-domain-containing protein [Xylaria arbuscula]|nr:RNA polymerase I-specific transcription initiation factor-domain-containing protein [Xylaria arbuscula]